MTRKVVSALVAAFSFSSATAFASPSGGFFNCETKPGHDPYGGHTIAGSVDGEVNVEELFLKATDGDDDRVNLEALEMSFGQTFALVAVDPNGQEDRTLVRIAAERGQGTSPALIEIRNGEEVSYLEGTCTIDFKAGY